MTLEPTTNFQLIKSILTQPDIWESSSEDGQSVDEFDVIEVPCVQWLIAKTDGGETAGCLMVERSSLSEASAHMAILKSFRGIGSASATLALLRYFVQNLDQRIHKLSVQIPEWNIACVKLAQAFSFKKEGINRQSVMKNGKLRDQICLGITREEAALCLQY